MLRRNADVSSTDGEFGVLTDIVVDPIDNTLTHLVVTPIGVHRQPRLIPLWLVTEDRGNIHVELDSAHVRQLQRALPGDFIRSNAPDIDTEHTVRFKTALRHPYFELPAPDGGPSEGVAKAEWEIRSDSDVVSCNDRHLGRIVGFLVDDDQVWGIIVRSGLAGFQHDVIVGVDSIAEVLDHMVLLDLDRHQFRRLPRNRLVPRAEQVNARLDVVSQTGARLWYRLRDVAEETWNNRIRSHR